MRFSMVEVQSSDLTVVEKLLSRDPSDRLVSFLLFKIPIFYDEGLFDEAGRLVEMIRPHVLMLSPPLR
jgi:hypothetical protein